MNNIAAKCSLCLCLCAQLACPWAVAQTAPAHTSGASSGVNFDLSSTSRSVTARIQSPVEIQLGQTKMTVAPNDLLTPAEMVAVRQVINTGAQAVLLNSDGMAIGGSVSINSNLMQRLVNLLIPQGVTALLNFTGGASINMSGNLTNSGQLFALAQNGTPAAVIQATNITNNAGSVISSVLPSTLSGGDFNQALNLDLRAAQNIVNAGQIVSAGDLTMAAGGSLINASKSSSQQATLQATSNVNLITGNLVNSGLITSTLNDININSILSKNLLMDNTGGSLVARNGVINFRDSTYIGQGNLSIAGGDFISRAINLYSGAGVVVFDAQTVTGLLNIVASEAHVSAATDNLQLGDLALCSDPTFFNTAGNVTISSNMVFGGQDLSIVASGDVTSSAPVSIDTSSSTTNGGNILIAAGANVSSNGTTLIISSGPGLGGGSATGGKINLSTSPIQALSSRGTAAGDSNAGNITLVAFAGNAAGSGTITLPTGNALTIRTGGNNSGRNGNVTMLAGAAGGVTSISLGNINASGGLNGTGDIVLTTAAPAVSNGNITVDIATGTRSGGEFTAGASQAASIVSNNLTASGSNVSISAGANASISSITDVGARSTGSNGGSVTIATNVSSNTGAPFVVGGSTPCANCIPSGIAVSAASGGLTGDAGTISISNYGTGGIKVTNPGLLSVPVLTLTGAGGTINLNAAAGLTAGSLDLAGGLYAADAAGSASGGKIILAGSQLTNTTNSTAWSFSAKGGVGTGNGGLLSITTSSATSGIAFGNAVRQISSITVQSGTSGGNGGRVDLSSGQNLMVTTTLINSRPQGTNGNGPTFNFTAATAGTGLLQISGSINASGAGTGSGGTVNLTYNDSANPFVIGSSLSGNGVTGSITADAPAAGLGGLVQLLNTAPASLSIALPGSISAASGSGQTGTIRLNSATNSVLLSGAGSITGLLTASGKTVDISTGAGGLLAGSINSSNGILNLSADGGSLVMTSSASAVGGTMSLKSSASSSITVNTGVSLVADAISMTTPVLNVNGTLSSLHGNVTVQSNNASNTLSINLSPAASMVANGANANVNLNPTGSGAIAVSGGVLSAAGSIIANGGTGNVSINVSSLSGSLAANGSSVSANAANGDLITGAITATNGQIALAVSNGSLVTRGSLSALTSASLGASKNVLINSSLSAANAIITAGSDLTVGAVLTAPTTSLTATDGDLLIKGVVTANNSANLNAGGNISTTSDFAAGAATIAAGSKITLGATLTTDKATITAGSNVTVDAALTATNASITAGSNLTVGAALTAPTTSLTAINGDLLINSAVTATNSANLTAGGNISVASPFSAGSAGITAGNNMTLSSTLTAATTSLTATKGDLLINGPVTASNSATLNAGGNVSTTSPLTTGTATITAGSSLTVGAALTADTASITAGANLTVGATLTAPTTSLTAKNGDVLINGAVTAGNSATLNAGGNVSITAPLTAGTGAITAGNNLTVSADVVFDISTMTATAGDLSINGMVTANSSLNLTAGHDIQLTKDVSAVDTTIVANNQLSVDAKVYTTTAYLAATNGDLSLSGTLSALSSASLLAGRDAVLNGSLSAQAGATVAASRNVSINGLITASGGLVSITTGSSGQLSQATGSTISGTAITLTTPFANLNGITNSTSADLNVQSNAQDNSVTVNLGANAVLTAAANLVFNGTGAGSVAVSGGSLSAVSKITLNAGTGDVSITTNSVAGTITASGSSVYVSIATGDLTTGSITASNGSITLASNYGNVLCTDAITANGAISATAAQNLKATSTISGNSLTLTATNGNILTSGELDATTAATITAALGLTMNNLTAGSANLTSSSSNLSAGSVQSAASLKATAAGNLSLNNATADSATLTSSNGDLSISGTMTTTTSLNATASRNMTLNNLSANSVTLTTASGDLNASGTMTATTSVSAIAAGSLTLGNVNGGTVVLTSSAGNVVGNGTITAGSSVNVSAANDLTINNLNSGSATLTSSGGNVTINGLVNASGALNISVGATSKLSVSAGASASGATLSASASSLLLNGALEAVAGDLSIQSNASNYALSGIISPTGGIYATASNGNVFFNGTNAGSVTFSGSGGISAGGIVDVNSAARAIDIKIGTIAGTVNAQAASISVSTTTGGLLLGNLNASNGSISASTGAGVLQVAQGQTLSASEGNLILVNTDSTSGSIVIGSGATLSASTGGPSLGRVILAIGQIPQSPTKGTAPANVNVNASNGGAVYWGASSIQSDAPSSTLIIDGGAVIFDAGTSAGSAIKLSGAVAINSHAINPNPPPQIVLSSLDLTDPLVVGQLLSLQAQGKVGGTLQVVNGLAVGGNAILDRSIIASSVSAENIPLNVTLTFKDFQAESPLNVTLNQQSSSSLVLINGTAQFVGSQGPSNAVVMISSQSAAPVLALGKFGSIISDGSLSISGTGTMKISGSILSANSLSLTTTANKGEIVLDAQLSAVKTITLNTNVSSGDITWKSGLLSAQNIFLTSSLGNIGSCEQKLYTATQSLQIFTGGSAYIQQLGTVSLLSSTVGNTFKVEGTGDLNVTGALKATDLALSTGLRGNMNLNASITANHSITLSTYGSGSIAQTAGTVSATTLQLASYFGSFGTSSRPLNISVNELQVTTLGGSAYLLASGSAILDSSIVGGSFNLSASGSLTVNSIAAGYGSINLAAGSGALTVNAGSFLFANEGNIRLQNNDLSAGSITLGRGATIFAFTLCDPRSGNVSLTIGPLPQTPVAGKTPSNVLAVSTYGGKVYFGSNGIDAGNYKSTVLALGRNVVFNTGARPGSAIKLEGKNTIIADPPPALSEADISGITSIALSNQDITRPSSTYSTSRSDTFVMPTIYESPVRRVLPLSGQDFVRIPETAEDKARPGTQPFQPISFSAIESSPKLEQMWLGSNRSTVVHYTGEIQALAKDDGRIALSDGQVLFFAQRTQQVTLPQGSLDLRAGSIVLVNAGSLCTSVRTLYEPGAGSVTLVAAGGLTTSIAAGQEAIFSKDQSSLQSMVNRQSIGRRRVSIHMGDRGMMVHRSEVPLTTVISTNELLKMVFSSNSDIDKKIAGRLLKMAATLMLATQGHGNYVPIK